MLSAESNFKGFQYYVDNLLLQLQLPPKTHTTVILAGSDLSDAHMCVLMQRASYVHSSISVALYIEVN